MYRRPVRIDRALLCAHHGLLTGGRAVIKFCRQRTKFAAITSIFLLATFSFAVTANAVEANGRNDSFSALRDYVQLIDTVPKLNTPQDSNNVTLRQSTNAAYEALRAFSERIGVDQPESTAGLQKLVAADNLLDFLRELNSSAPPSAAPSATSKKGPAAGGTQPSTPVAATYVGAKVCVTCHAAQAEAFSQTLMGKIGKTQKGKFDCESCHGPGSAHVKAGGGRGAGGII
jgi:hypothetical protein